MVKNGVGKRLATEKSLRVPQCNNKDNEILYEALRAISNPVENL